MSASYGRFGVRGNAWLPVRLTSSSDGTSVKSTALSYKPMPLVDGSVTMLNSFNITTFLAATDLPQSPALIYGLRRRIGLSSALGRAGAL